MSSGQLKRELGLGQSDPVFPTPTNLPVTERRVRAYSQRCSVWPNTGSRIKAWERGRVNSTVKATWLIREIGTRSPAVQSPSHSVMFL